MKKRLITLLCIVGLLVFGSMGNALADWTIESTYDPSQAGNYVIVKTVLTSDGSALSATDIIGYLGFPGTAQGTSALWLYVEPGTSTVAPDAAIDITMSNDFDAELWADTAISYTAGTWHQLWSDIGAYPPVLRELNIALNDIGDEGDQVTLYFILWAEKK